MHTQNHTDKHNTHTGHGAYQNVCPQPSLTHSLIIRGERHDEHKGIALDVEVGNQIPLDTFLVLVYEVDLLGVVEVIGPAGESTNAPTAIVLACGLACHQLHCHRERMLHITIQGKHQHLINTNHHTITTHGSVVNGFEQPGTWEKTVGNLIDTGMTCLVL